MNVETKPISGVLFLLFAECYVVMCGEHDREALSKLLKCEGVAGVEGAILPYVGHLQFISTLKIGADSCQLCQYKLT